MRSFQRLMAPALFLLTGATSAIGQSSLYEAIGELDGVWQTDGQSCDVSSTDDTKPVVIKGGVFNLYESECAFQSARIVSNTLQGTLLCYGEGEEWNEGFVRDRQTLEFTKEGVTFRSCSR
ncbi:MAG: hypothetical protein KF810_22975 [Rhizobiaceae bacterium]|nr:hypothetical protein [Rhizobiaceae bacterium]